MEAPIIRPTFTIPLRSERDETVERLRAGLVARGDLQGRWRGRGIWAELYVPEPEKRLWSPYLSVRVDESPDGSALFGRFGPHPEVWTFFMFLYFGVAFLVAFGGTFAYVQWASGESPWALWSLWLGIPTLALIHLASALGRRWGQDQMRELKATLEQVLESAGISGA
ncbi:MAG: hypothetical protein ACR2QM_11425 [Longimicrobiales bacterium]